MRDSNFSYTVEKAEAETSVKDFLHHCIDAPKKMVQQHGSLARAIRCVHLHQSLSDKYVQAHTGRLPDDLPQDDIERFCTSYAHILQIDQHLAASSDTRRMEAVELQTDTLKRGGFLHDI